MLAFSTFRLPWHTVVRNIDLLDDPPGRDLYLLNRDTCLLISRNEIPLYEPPATKTTIGKRLLVQDMIDNKFSASHTPFFNLVSLH